MATSIRDLRIKARKLGATNVREMDEDELEEYIADNTKSKNGKKSKKTAVKAVKKATGKKRGRPKKVRDDDDDEDEDEAPRKRGRPKGSTNKAKASKAKRGRPVGSGKASKKERTNGRKNPVGRPPGSGTGTRITLGDKINFNRDFDFREGSTAQYILTQIRKSAKKYKDTEDIREDVIDRLEDKINKVDELTFNNRSTGKPHKGESAQKMLRYRVNRTMLDYAIETDQHEGANGDEDEKPKKKKPGRPPKSETTKKRGRPRKVRDEDEDDEEDERPAKKKKRGRPPGSKNKKSTTKAEKRGPGRPKGSGTGKKRGRPKGSKNKK